MAKKRSLKEGLIEFLESWDESDDAGGEDDDVITLRGPSARALLGILEGGGAPKGDDDDQGDGGDGPDPEAAPQRGHSRYFGGDK